MASPRLNPADDALRRGSTSTHRRRRDGAPAASAEDGSWGGLVGNFIGDRQFHGGNDQAVYAYAREDLDNWQPIVGHPIGNGTFGENLTTSAVDVTNAVVGEGGGMSAVTAWFSKFPHHVSPAGPSLRGSVRRAGGPSPVVGARCLPACDQPGHGVRR